jgi:nucleotide-binding universal stress UspA family protein
MLKILIPVDGSDNSLRTVKNVVDKAALYKDPLEIHLLNVQRPFPGTIRGVKEQADQHHRDEGNKALAGVRKLLDDAGIKYAYHISVGEPAEVIARSVKDLKVDQVVMGTRGAGAVANMLIGSVAQKVLHLVDVPVLLVK